MGKVIICVSLLFMLTVSVQGACDQEFNKQMLACHNKLRAKHGAPPLKFDEKLCEQADSYAKTLLSTNNYVHSKNVGKYGENLNLAGTTEKKDAADSQMASDDACNAWYAEREQYDYETGTSVDGSEILHFTQMMWINTKSIGCGRAYDTEAHKSGAYKGFYLTYVCCNYLPTGNVKGSFTKNVLPEQ